MKFLPILAAGMLPFLFQGGVLTAQEDDSGIENTIDLWGKWRDGFEKFEAAERAAEVRNFPEALRMYEASRDAFESVRNLNPNWQKNVIGYRIDLCKRKIEALKQYAGKPAPVLKKVLPKPDATVVSAGQIARLKSQLEAAEKELRSLKKTAADNAASAVRLEGLMREKNDLLKKQAALQVLLEDARARLTGAEKKIRSNALLESEKKRSAELSERLVVLEKNLKSMTESRRESDRKHAESERALREATIRLTELTAVSKLVTTLEKDKKDLLAQTERMKKDQETLSAAARSSAKQIEQLNANVLQLKKQLEMETAKNLSAQVDLLKQENSRLRAGNQKLAAEMAEYTALKQQLESIKKEFALLQEKHGNAGKALLRFARQHAELESARKALSQAGTDVETLKKALGKAGTDKEALAVELAKVKQQVLQNGKLGEEQLLIRQKLEQRVKVLQDQLSKAVKSDGTLSASYELELTKLKNEAAVLKTTLLDREKILKERDAVLKRLEAQKISSSSEALLKQKETEIAALKKEITALREVGSTKTMRAEIAALTAAVSELKEGKAQYDSALKNMTAKVEALQKDKQKLEIELANSKIETDAARKALKQPLPQGELERRNNELLESSTKYEKLYLTTRAERDELSARVKTLDREMAEAGRKIKTMDIAGERLRNELKQWRSQTPGVDARALKNKDDALTALMAESEDRKKEMSILKEELLMAHNGIGAARRETTALRRRLRSAQEEIRALKLLNPERYLALEQKRRKTLSEESSDVEKKTTSALPVQKKSGETVLPPAGKKQAPVVDRKTYDSAMKIASEAEKKGDLANALMNYWRAVDADSSSGNAYAGLARIYVMRKEIASAVKAYEKARSFGYPADRALEEKLK